MTPRPPTDIVLRPAVMADTPCLSALAMQVFLGTYATTGIRASIADEVLRSFSVTAFANLLQRPDVLIEVAERDCHLIGLAQVCVGRAQELVHTRVPAELDRLYVQEPFTHRGVGTRLLARAESLAATRGATALRLTPWVHNARALQFYRKHAYVDLGTTWFHMDGERHENRVLLKPLAP